MLLGVELEGWSKGDVLPYLSGGTVQIEQRLGVAFRPFSAFLRQGMKGRRSLFIRGEVYFSFLVRMIFPGIHRSTGGNLLAWTFLVDEGNVDTGIQA